MMRTLLMTVALVSVLTMSGCHKATVKVTNLNPGDYGPSPTANGIDGDVNGEINGDIAVWLLNEAEAKLLQDNPNVGTALDLPFKVVAAHKIEKFPNVCKGVYAFIAANAADLDAIGDDLDFVLVPGQHISLETVVVRKYGTICVTVRTHEEGGPPIIGGEVEGEVEVEPEL